MAVTANIGLIQCMHREIAFVLALAKNTPEYASTNAISLCMHWIKPMFAVTAIVLLLYYGAGIPMGRFLLTLVPALYDFKHSVYEKPEDIVAARRERSLRKDMLRKEVARLRKRTDENA